MLMRRCIMGSIIPVQVLTLLLLSSLHISSMAPPPSGYRFMLTHIDSRGGFTKSELMRRAAHRSRRHVATMQSGNFMKSSSLDPRPTRLHSGQAEYLMELAIGTPPVPFIALADTGSDLTWTQCKPCKLCFPQDTPIYDPTASSSFFLVTCSSASCLPEWSSNCSATSPCKYGYAYDDGAYSFGIMGTEALTFGISSSSSSSPGVSIGGIAFGCGVDNGGLSYNSTGTVGLGQGSLSLVTQLGVGKFSYCLTDFFNSSMGSPLLFGSHAELLPGAATVQSTPFRTQDTSWYDVTLEGISLGDSRLPIPNGAFDGTGGMMVDSGTTFTVLVESAFRVVVEHVADVLGQPVVNSSSLDSPCFPAPAGERQLPEMPELVLHFAGGADMRLHRDSYMFFDEEESSFCLAIVGTTSFLVLGNFQQQNIHMLFDITEGQLSFVPTDCSKL